jgi:ATP-binding cassette, subfamily F, member 3
VIEPEGCRVVEGNYDAMVDQKDHGTAGSSDSTKKEPEPVSKDNARAPHRDESRKASSAKRRFPYRKVEELEAEIFQRETLLEEAHAALAAPETHRDGKRVRQLKHEIDQQKAALANLYAHWEEATELNW